MRKLIAAINMTIDGFCDHTSVIADDELHQHYTDRLRDAGTLLYGRKTFRLMEYWREVLNKPTGNKATDEFALVMDKVPKIVFSNTIKSTDWQSACLATKSPAATVKELKQIPGKDIFAGSPSLIVSLTQSGLIDEYQLCIHPVIAGKGLPLFNGIKEALTLRLVKTKRFASGAMVLYYQRQ